MLKLYKRTIIACIWIFVILFSFSIFLKAVFSGDDTISFLQNYIIGITCSILVVTITTFLQYKSEHEKAMAEFVSILRQLILSLSVALSFQEKNVDEEFCGEIVEKIKDKCDRLNQLNKSYSCFSRKRRQKHVELVKTILKLYIPLLDNPDDSYYDLLIEKVNYSTYIELAQKSREFIEDDINRKLIDELIKRRSSNVRRKNESKEHKKDI